MTGTGAREKQDVNPEVQPAPGGAAAGWCWTVDTFEYVQVVKVSKGKTSARSADLNRRELADRADGADAGENRQEKLSYTVGLGIAVACFLTAWGLHGNGASTYRIGSQWSAFTGLFILALAIERVLEPFSRYLGPDSTKHKNAGDGAEVERCRRLTTVVTRGVATGLAFLLCAQLNITLLQAVRANGSGRPPFWADLLVTGLVVGAGTKPLHDLVCNIERPKDAQQDPSPTRAA